MTICDSALLPINLVTLKKFNPIGLQVGNEKWKCYQQQNKEMFSLPCK